MNLGAFAGGAVQGYQSQERLNLAQKSEAQQADMQNRRMAMAEQDQAAQQEERQRIKDLRTDSAALFTKYYGTKETTEGVTSVDDGQGGVSTVPTKKFTTIQPGQDPKVDAQWYSDHLRLTASKSGMSTQDMAAVAAQVDNARRTEFGRKFDKVLNGDEAALGDVLKAAGKDPKGAKLEFRPAEGIQRIALADGTFFDLKRAAMMTATAAFYKEMQETEKSAQAGAKNQAAVSNLGAARALAEARASEIPSQINKNNAEAGKASSQGALARAKAGAVGAGGGGGNPKAEKELRAELDKLAPHDPLGDGKAKDLTARAFMSDKAGQHLRSGKSPQQAAVAANKEYRELESQAGAWASKLSTMKPADRKAKYGASDIETIKQQALRKAIAAQGVSSAPADETDD